VVRSRSAYPTEALQTVPVHSLSYRPTSLGAAAAHNIGGVFTSYWRHRQLILQMARRDVLGRYRGSLLGLAWSFLTPLLMLLVYTFLFGVVFKARWGSGTVDSRLDFALILFVGLIVHGLFAECVNRAPGLILQHASFVKRVVFPLEILPWSVMLSALFHSAVSLTIWFVFAMASGIGISPTAAYLPLVFVPLVLLTTAVPQQFRFLIRLNPLTFVVEQARAVLTFHSLPDFPWLAVVTLQNLLLAALGLWWFKKTRRGFGDVI
jgi:lipopolysaccharide transport system permease protein